MKNFLEQIKQHIESNGIPFKNIFISANYFPKEFNEAAVNKLRGNSKNVSEITNYQIYYENGQIYLIATAENNISKLIILESNFKYNDELYLIQGFKTQEFHIIHEANRILEYNYINAKKLLYNHKLLDSVNIEPLQINDLLDKTAKDIKDYIDYLNNYYNENIKKNSNHEIIFASKEAANTGITRTTPTYTGIKKERKNPIIPLDERNEIFMEQNPVYQLYAKDLNNRDDHVCYVYENENINKYIVIMEPVKGISSTKAIAVDNLDEEFIDKTVKDILEIPPHELSSKKIVIILNHTTKEKFKNDTKLLTGKDGIKMTPSKYKIKQKIKANW